MAADRRLEDVSDTRSRVTNRLACLFPTQQRSWVEGVANQLSIDSLTTLVREITEYGDECRRQERDSIRRLISGE